MLNVFQRENVTDGLRGHAVFRRRAAGRGRPDTGVFQKRPGCAGGGGRGGDGLWATADIPCPYALFERVRGEVTALGGTVDEAVYGADIRLRVSLPAQTAETLRARLTELSAGGIALTVSAEEYRPGGRVESGMQVR